MNSKRFAWIGAAAAVAVITGTWEAGGASLKVGDPAPKLQAGKWVQGEPIKALEAGKAYIVEFWATWCGPCRVSIPHLNEIHTKFKEQGLVVIGQDCWENDESQVAPFVKKMGDKMTYRVALDDKTGNKNGAMAETWMSAAGQRGIPAAFLVNKESKIAWIGHPMQLKEALIEQVLSGKHDLKQAAAEAEAEAAVQEKMTKLSRELNSAVQQKEWDKAEAAMTEMERTLPESKRSQVAPMRFQVLLMKEDFKEAAKVAFGISEANKSDAMMQNQLAWALLTHKSIKERDLDTAEKIAARANEASQGKEPGVLDTYARALFMQGKKTAAIELQEKAVSLATGDMKSELQKTLDSYKEGKLPAAE